MATVEQKQRVHEIFQKGVKTVLEEAHVPLKYHLKVVEELHRVMGEHGKDIKDFREALATHEQIVKRHAAQLDQRDSELARQKSEHSKTVEAHQAVLETLQMRQGEKGEKGSPGKDGESARPLDLQAVTSAVLAKIPLPEKGDKGDPADFDETTLMEKIIKRFQKGDVLHINHVKGAGGFIKDGIKYRFEELMHGAGSSAPSSGFTTWLATETPNGNLTAFTFASATAKPSYIVSDNVWMKAVSAAGTVNWTWAGSVATMTIPPVDDIFAVK